MVKSDKVLQLRNRLQEENISRDSTMILVELLIGCFLNQATE